MVMHIIFIFVIGTKTAIHMSELVTQNSQRVANFANHFLAIKAVQRL